MSYLLDTNVLSELRKPQGNANVKRWFAGVDGDALFLSVLVLGEIKQGVVRLSKRDSAQAAVYESWLRTLKTDYRERVLELNSEIAERWGVLNAHESLPVIDGLLAATALVHGLTLVTRNTKDVARSGVETLNPFEVA